jgi:hypothetical protein
MNDHTWRNFLPRNLLHRSHLSGGPTTRQYWGEGRGKNLGIGDGVDELGARFNDSLGFCFCTDHETRDVMQVYDGDVCRITQFNELYRFICFGYEYDGLVIRDDPS